MDRKCPVDIATMEMWKIISPSYFFDGLWNICSWSVQPWLTDRISPSSGNCTRKIAMTAKCLHVPWGQHPLAHSQWLLIMFPKRSIVIFNEYQTCENRNHAEFTVRIRQIWDIDKIDEMRDKGCFGCGDVGSRLDAFGSPTDWQAQAVRVSKPFETRQSAGRI